MRNSLEALRYNPPKRFLKTIERVGGRYDIIAGGGQLGTAFLADMKGEVLSIDSEIEGYRRDIELFIKRHPDNVRLLDYYNGQLVPFYIRWKAFALEHSHWYNNMWMSSYYSALDFRERLGQLVAGAIALGYNTPTVPTAPKSNDLYKALDAGKNALTSVWGTLKYIIWIAIGVLAVGFAIYLSNSRTAGTMAMVKK